MKDFCLGVEGSKKPLVLFRAVAGTQPADMSSTSFFGAKRSFLKSTGFLNVPGTTTSLAHCCASMHVFVGRRGRGAGQLYVLCNVVSKGFGYAKDQA